MCMYKLVATDANGKKTTVNYVYFDRYDVAGTSGGDGFDGKARNFKLSGERMNIQSGLEELAAGTYTMTVEITVSTGEIFTPATFQYTK